MQQDQSTLGAMLVALFAWAVGPTGQQWVAGGAGGLVRWALAGRGAMTLGRWLLSGLVNFAAGMVTAAYGWPIALWAIQSVTGDLGPPGPDPQSTAMAAFAAGMLGLSMARMVIAAVDRRAPKILDKAMGGDDANP